MKKKQFSCKGFISLIENVHFFQTIAFKGLKGLSFPTRQSSRTCRFHPKITKLSLWASENAPWIQQHGTRVNKSLFGRPGPSANNLCSDSRRLRTSSFSEPRAFVDPYTEPSRNPRHYAHFSGPFPFLLGCDVTEKITSAKFMRR